MAERPRPAALQRRRRGLADRWAGTSQLLRRADIARYAAKAAGGNRIHFFNDRMGRQYEDRLLLQRTIDAAIAAESFRLEYQPIIDLRSRKAVGLRGADPHGQRQGREISPAIFIPAAEHTGAIEVIGRWALMHACRFAADWPPEPSGDRGEPVTGAIRVRGDRQRHRNGAFRAGLRRSAWRSRSPKACCCATRR